MDFSAAARISELVNNADGNWKIQTLINTKDGNLAPKIDLPIIYEVPMLEADGVTVLSSYSFDVGSTDPNADKIRFRLANSDELGNGGQTNPVGLAINSNTGKVTWTNSGTLGVGLYSGGIVAEDVDSSGNIKSKSHVDFILELINKPAVAFTPSGNIPDSRNIIVEKGNTYNFSITGTSVDVSSLGNIQGALTEPTEGNFVFDPGAVGSGLDAGTYPITFEVFDTTGNSTKSYLILNFIVPDPRAPKITNIEGDATTYAATVAQLVDLNVDAVVSDQDSAGTPVNHLNNGFMRFNVTFTDGQYEILNIQSVGDGAGEIRRFGLELYYEGSKIGDIDPFEDGVGRALRIDFGTVSIAAVQALVRSLTYEDTFVLRSNGQRNLSLFIQDEDGLNRNYSLVVDVQDHPDKPANGGPVQVNNNLSLADGDSVTLSTENLTYVDPDDNAAGVTLTVSNVTQGQFELLTASGVAITSFTQEQIDQGQIQFVHNGSGTAPTYSVTASDGTNTDGPNVAAISFEGTSADFISLNENSVGVSLITGDNVVGTPSYVKSGSAADNGLFTVNPASGSLAFINAPDFEAPADADGNNVFVVEVTVTGGTSGSDVRTITVTLLDVNESPTIGGSAAITGSEGTAYSFTPSSSDPEGDSLTFSISNMPSWASFNTSNGALTGTPGYTDAGTYNNVEISVSDGTSVTSLSAFSIVVSDTNRAPTISGTPTTTVAETVAYSFTPTGSDPDGDSLTYSITNMPSWASFSTATGALTGTPGYADSGNYNNIVISVSDGALTTSLATFNLVVTNSNRAPTINGTPAITIAEGSAYSFTPTGNDLDGDSLTYSITNMPSWASFSTSTGELSGTPGYTDAGSYPNIIISVSDGGTPVSLAAFSISVSDTNRAPVANVASVNVVENVATVITLSGSDADGDSVTYSVVSSPAGALSGTAPNLTYTPSSNFVGADSFTFKVNDGTTDSANATVSITVLGDLDGDGDPDVTDPDDDGDGISDIEEGNGDLDGDGIPNSRDTDSDNDGINDSVEGNVDADGDGTPNYLDLDSDGDGINDSVEGNVDADGDGTPNYLDLDSDGDGINDSAEGNVDTDGDGTPNYLDIDSDGDGIPDSSEGTVDTDGDGIPDYLDTDSDGDGIDDADEGGADTDGDGIPDNQDPDADGDGIDDSVEGNGDTDGDGIPDNLDSDSDNDGIDDSVEGNVDSDDDGIPDYLDDDSDGDGIPDEDEGTGDTDGDGTPDYLDTSIDEDNDGTPDIIEGTNDTDGDGIPDFQDPDSDNDGLSDAAESGVTGIDSDNDGIDDAVDVDQTGGEDANKDGIDDNVASRDTDEDGIADYLDIDSDDDGIPDVVELYLRSGDADFDGIADAVDVDITGGTDEDADGIDDSFDVDATGGIDADNDGIDDLAQPLSDRDADGLVDYLDLDSDNDGIADTAEGDVSGVDSDADGIDDSFDVDSTFGLDINFDGIDDDAVVPDTDGDSVPDLHDLDSDNDGLFDTIEAAILDVNEDALADTAETLEYAPVDTDLDGVADYRDLDSDDDGAHDIDQSPAQVLDADDDGQIDISVDLDGDGIDDAQDEQPTVHGSRGDDDDDDGVPSTLDNDQDADGIADVTEGAGDTDGDGIADYLDRDSDNDGLSDAFETDRPAPLGLDTDLDGIDDAYDVDATGGSDDDLDGVDDVFAQVDTDGDGIADYLDSDSDNDGVSDSEEQVLAILSGVDSDNDGIDDAVDVDATGGSDANFDGVDDSLVSDSDLDNDGLMDFRDTDSDNDGVSDGDEDGDYNGDGINDRLQLDNGVETGVTGGGSTNFWFATILLAAVLVRRRPQLAAGLVLLISVLPMSGQAAQSCDFSSAFDSNECWYVGGGVGYSRLQPEPNDSAWRVIDNNDKALRLFAGFEFNENFFTEITYESMGAARLNNLNPAITDQLNVNYSALGAHLGYLLNEKSAIWNFYATAGLSFMNTDTGTYVDQDYGNQLTFGAGVQWRFADNWFARFGLTSYDRDARVIGISIAKSLGSAEKTAATVSPKPATRPQPAPEIAPSAPAVEPVNPDLDGDGVLNALDNCPDTQAEVKVNSTGCPLMESITLNIQFDTGLAEVKEQYLQQILQVAEKLKQRGDVKVTVEGHTDWKGKQVKNQPLSEARATAVAEILKQESGLAEDNFTVIGYGELQPVADNSTEEGRYNNRRVVVIISQ